MADDNSNEYFEPLDTSKVFKSVSTTQEFLGLPKKLTITIFAIVSLFAAFNGFRLIYIIPAFMIIGVAKLIVKDDPKIFDIVVKNTRYPKKLD